MANNPATEFRDSQKWRREKVLPSEGEAVAVGGHAHVQSLSEIGRKTRELAEEKRSRPIQW